MARSGRGLRGTLGAERNGDGLSLYAVIGDIDHDGPSASTAVVFAVWRLSVVVVTFLLHGHIAVLVLILVLALSLLAPVLCCLCACGRSGLWSRRQARRRGGCSRRGRSRKGRIEYTVLQVGHLCSLGDGSRYTKGALQLSENVRFGLRVRYCLKPVLAR